MSNCVTSPQAASAEPADFPELTDFARLADFVELTKLPEKDQTHRK